MTRVQDLNFEFCFITSYQQFLYFCIKFQTKPLLAEKESLFHSSFRWVRVKERQIIAALYFLNDYNIS